MRLLMYEWTAYMQEDLKAVLNKLGIEFEGFSYQFEMEEGLYSDDYFLRNFGRILREGTFDAVISLNYWPLVAECCHRENRPYIAWVYDCPLPIKRFETFSYPTSHVFLFDRVQYEDFVSRGYQTVYHMPLAVNVDRLDEIRLTSDEIKQYGCDVSFVGNMYASDYLDLRLRLNEYERGYLEGLIETQYRVYGLYYIGEMLGESLLDPMQKRFEGPEEPDEERKELFRKYVELCLGREITRRERLLLLSAVSARHHLKLYANAVEKMLVKADYRGTVDSHYSMPKVFRASKINLNITYKQITVGMPLRVLDIMGAGGFLLSNYQEELVENFRPGIDCVIYESVADAIQKVEYYLQHEDERREIAANGHEAARRFSYERQLDHIFTVVFGAGYGQSGISE